MYINKKASPSLDDAQTVVGILGLEPRMTGPESVVLPLHHIPMNSLKKLLGYSDSNQE